MESNIKIIAALHFASEKHKFQCRKGEASVPYINHPIQVARVLSEVGGEDDTNLLVSAILHDTIEDTKTSENEIEKRFGSEVLSIVKEVSDDKNLSKAERKQAQIDTASSLSMSAKKLKLADKISNVRDMTLDPPARWTAERKLRYIDWAEAVVNNMRGTNKKLEAFFDTCAESSRSKIRALAIAEK